MSNYVKSTNFASKDSLLTGNPSKLIRGTEIDTEFNAIATAVSTKADTVSPTFTGTPLAPTAAAGTDSTQIATTAYVDTQFTGGSNTFTGTQSFQDTSLEVFDNSDNTKKAKFNVSNVTTGTTRTLDVPNKNGTIAVTTDFGALNAANNTVVSGTYAATASSTITITATHAFSVGQEVFVRFVNTSGSALTEGNFTITGVTGGTSFTITYGSSVTSAGNVTAERYGLVAIANTTDLATGTSETKVVSVKQLRDNALTLGTAQTPTGVNFVEFTNIPSWVKKITVSYYRVSGTAGGQITVQLGVGGVVTTSGYVTYVTSIGASFTDLDGLSNGIVTSVSADSGTVVSGNATITKVEGNKWVASGSFMRSGDSRSVISQGSIELSGTLDTLRVIRASGNYDAGTINIMYE